MIGEQLAAALAMIVLTLLIVFRPVKPQEPA